jgi:hypothetical protein
MCSRPRNTLVRDDHEGGSRLAAVDNTAHRQEILDSDARFFRALLNRDVDSLRELLAPDFLIVDVNSGGLTSRADFLAAVDSWHPASA